MNQANVQIYRFEVAGKTYDMVGLGKDPYGEAQVRLVQALIRDGVVVPVETVTEEYQKLEGCLCHQ